MRRYIPDRGDVVWLDFDPQTGHEQAGRRPALVISPRAYNRKTGLAIFCPITSRVKGYPFEVTIPRAVGCEGVILADQVRNLDWPARKSRFLGRADAATLDEVISKLGALIFPRL
jgi:mRNA interferase MazF